MNGLNGYDKDNPRTKSEYYYGCSFKEWENLSYFDAIEMRRNKAKELFVYLDSIKNPDYETRVRTHKVYKAWMDNDKLLEERNG